MGTTRPVKPVKLFCGIIGTDEQAVGRARLELETLLGKVDIAGEVIPFDFTDYYEKEMGRNLLRQFISFEKLVDPRNLAEIKISTNRIEEKLSMTLQDAVRRTVNLDPGYITASNLVLATTKDFSHRICIGEGIYAEVTLNFRKNGCVFFDWTYPDFKSGKYTAFFLKIRTKYMEETKNL